MTGFAESWARAWKPLGIAAPVDLRARLLAAYSEPHRRYHSVRHLEECLGHLEDAIGLAHRPGEVELALWFHDAVYEPRATDNEQRSAAWAARSLAGNGVDAPTVERVRALILATSHAALPAGADQALLVDLDLAILGASPERFAEYERQVREEYRWVPAFIYRWKRRQLLQSFLARPVLYHTPLLRDRFERQARANLAAAVA